uniref:Uncharacterized protein n=1 Tax=Anguilla anguilla TaxID=7936 RepID=A0A0E9R8I8_ANGAN
MRNGRACLDMCTAFPDLW